MLAIVDRHTIESHLARAERQEASNGLEQSGFATTTRAKQTDNLPRFNVQRERF